MARSLWFGPRPARLTLLAFMIGAIVATGACGTGTSSGPAVSPATSCAPSGTNALDAADAKSGNENPAGGGVAGAGNGANGGASGGAKSGAGGADANASNGGQTDSSQEAAGGATDSNSAADGAPVGPAAGGGTVASSTTTSVGSGCTP